MTKNKIIFIAIVILIIASVSYWYFKKEQINSQPLFKTQKPIKQDLVQYVNASGTLKAKDEISVGSLVAGKVIKILVDDNDFVKKDQILVILDDGVGDSAIKQLKAVLLSTKANLVYQEKFYKRQTELFKSEQLSKDNFEKYTRDTQVLRDRVAEAAATLEIKQKEYDNLFIKSPDDGIVIAKEVNLGQMITSVLQATVLFIIAKDLHIMEAHVDVDEADIGMVQEGQEAIFTVDAFPKVKFKAKVRQIRYLAKIVENVVTYATILDVSNPDLKLRPGMTTNVDIKVAQTKNALVVKNKVLRINSNHLELVANKLGYKFIRLEGVTSKSELDTIWIIENGNTFKQIKVEIGTKEGSLSEIRGNQINEKTEIISEVTELNKENVLLQQMFNQPGTIGSKEKKEK